jgi:hypothetical protein
MNWYKYANTERKIFRNPDKATFQALLAEYNGGMRGALMFTGDLYVGNGDYHSHADLLKGLKGIKGNEFFRLNIASISELNVEIWLDYHEIFEDEDDPDSKIILPDSYAVDVANKIKGANAIKRAFGTPPQVKVIVYDYDAFIHIEETI